METPFMTRSFPKAILHVDGDSFFASCEIAKEPGLRGKAVVTGEERGIATAMSYEAKRRGVTRGMKLSEVRRVCPEAIILSSDYETYSLYANRMYSIVRRFTPAVEEYSIDECFADLTGLRSFHGSYEKMAQRIKHDLELELGLTFSVGLAPTKVLAKVASKWRKPAGFTVIPGGKIHRYLSKLPVGDVWGIGPQTSLLLQKYGVATALDFTSKDERWINEYLAKPFYEIWKELWGISLYPVSSVKKTDYQSLTRTETFRPPSSDRNFIFSQLSKNIEDACRKARQHSLVTCDVAFFLKTQNFHYDTCEVRLSRPVSVPQEILSAIAAPFEKIFKPKTLYRTTGVTLLKLCDNTHDQLDLFGVSAKVGAVSKVFETIDALSERYGKHTVFLGSSLSPESSKGKMPLKRMNLIFKGAFRRKRLNIPMLGEAH